jgi:hypothetical protein
MISAEMHIENGLGGALITSDGHVSDAGHGRQLTLESPDLVDALERTGGDRDLMSPAIAGLGHRAPAGEQGVDAVEHAVQRAQEMAELCHVAIRR